MFFGAIFRLGQSKFSRRDCVRLQQLIQRMAVLLFLINQLYDPADQNPGQRMGVPRREMPGPDIRKKLVVDVVHTVLLQ